MVAGKPKHGCTDKSALRKWKRKQGYEILKKGMKKSVICDKLEVNRRTLHNLYVELEQSMDLHSRKQPGAKEKLEKIIDSGLREYG